jgi:hypothetical protein
MIGIIDQAEYLAKLCWMMPNGQEKVMVRIREPYFGEFNPFLRTTTLSADDVVEYCQVAGYVAEDFKSSKWYDNYHCIDTNINSGDRRHCRPHNDR